MCIIRQEDSNSFFADTTDPAYSKHHSTIGDAIRYTRIICGHEPILIELDGLSESTIAELYELKLSGEI